MNQNYQRLIGELIGLTRAADGNEHLITPSSTEVLVNCLCCDEHDSAAISRLLERVLEEKRKMVPDCFLCANPCGRTSAFDLSTLVPGEVRELKLQLLEQLRHLARVNPTADEGLLYRGIVVIGMEDYEPQDLLPLIEAVQKAASVH